MQLTGRLTVFCSKLENFDYTMKLSANAKAKDSAGVGVHSEACKTGGKSDNDLISVGRCHTLSQQHPHRLNRSSYFLPTLIVFVGTNAVTAALPSWPHWSPMM